MLLLRISILPWSSGLGIVSQLSRDELTNSYGCKNQPKSEGVYQLIDSHSNSLISSD
jgi:hypothetical protein